MHTLENHTLISVELRPNLTVSVWKSHDNGQLFTVFEEYDKNGNLQHVVIESFDEETDEIKSEVPVI